MALVAITEEKPRLKMIAHLQVIYMGNICRQHFEVTNPENGKKIKLWGVNKAYVQNELKDSEDKYIYKKIN